MPQLFFSIRRDGLSLLDQAMSNQNNKIDTKTINSMLGLADRNKIFDLLEFIFQGNATNALNVYKDLFSLYKIPRQVIINK